MKRHNPRFLAFLLSIALWLPGCENRDTKQQLSQLSADLKHTLDEAKQAVSDLAPDTSKLSARTNEEIEKLFRFEYKVEELDIKSSREALEEALVKLGLDRWDCFHLESNATALRIFCKRMPRTYLRYMLRAF